MANVVIKRKRGRPRRDEPPEINEFDISLIREFARRPAFYDRSCVHYRNRDYLDQQWEEMAETLGYSVSLIKDRMIQLRNRFNLEKRRVESMQEQYNDENIKSQWPLYSYMTFLGGYIKARRPYRYTNKSLLSSSTQRHINSSNSSSEADDYEESQNNTSNDTESELQQRINSNKRVNPLANSTIDHSSETSHNNNRGPLVLPRCQQKRKHESEQPRKMFKDERRELLSAEKYKAFGQFLAASLIEMNELDALQLVNKFTADLVRSMHTDLRAKMGHNTSDNASDNVEISI